MRVSTLSLSTLIAIALSVTTPAGAATLAGGCEDGFAGTRTFTHAVNSVQTIVPDPGAFCSPVSNLNNQEVDAGGNGSTVSATLGTGVAASTSSIAVVRLADASSIARGIVQLEFTVDGPAPVGAVVDVDYDIHLATIAIADQASDGGHAEIVGEGAFDVSVLNGGSWFRTFQGFITPAQDTVGVLNLQDTLRIITGDTYFAELRVTAGTRARGTTGISGATVLAEIALEMTMALQAPDGYTINWAAAQALNLPAPQVDQIFTSAVPLPAAIWLFVCALIPLYGRARTATGCSQRS